LCIDLAQTHDFSSIKVYFSLSKSQPGYIWVNQDKNLEWTWLILKIPKLVLTGFEFMTSMGSSAVPPIQKGHIAAGGKWRKNAKFRTC